MTDDSDALWNRLRAAAGVGDHSVPEDLDGTEVPARPYLLEPGLAAAAEIAIRLAQPLLLTGDPGTGKTQFAIALARRLGMPLLRCNIRSTTTVADLFYGIDEVARFRDAQPGAEGLLPFQYYLTFNGLGRAVLFAGGPEAPIEPLRDRLVLPRAPTKASPDPPTRFDQLYPAAGFPSPMGCRVVALLDEFDKAPRDTPNDMLNELEEMRFEISELGLAIAAPRELRPITIVTSNSERSLPDPFLRRCIYYDITFPGDIDRLRLIVAQHLEPFGRGESRLVGEVLALFVKLRQQQLTRKPGTAELLDWLNALRLSPLSSGTAASLRESWRSDAESVRHTLPAIIKARDDQDRIEQFLRSEYGPPGNR